MNKITKLMVGTSLLAASVAASAWSFGNDSWSWGKDYSYNSGPYSNSWGSGGPWGNNTPWSRNNWRGNNWGGNNAPWNWGNGRNGWGGNSAPWNWGNSRSGWGGNNWGGNSAPWNWGNNNRRYYGPAPYGPGYGAPAPMYGPGSGNDFDPSANPYINPPPAPEAPVTEQPAAPAGEATPPAK